MSILIKGIEMPKDGDFIVIRPNGKAYYVSANPKNAYDGEALPVPSHGNLIEKHDVFKLIQAFPEIDKLLTVEFMTALYNLPTIIPTEENNYND